MKISAMAGTFYNFVLYTKITKLYTKYTHATTKYCQKEKVQLTLVMRKK